MRISKEAYERNTAYIKNNYDQIKIQSRKEYRLRELIAIAADRRGISSAQYITEAIQLQLDHDGITPDMLPEQNTSNE